MGVVVNKDKMNIISKNISINLSIGYINWFEDVGGEDECVLLWCDDVEWELDDDDDVLLWVDGSL